MHRLRTEFKYRSIKNYNSEFFKVYWTLFWPC